jgi:hypothetical protein
MAPLYLNSRSLEIPNIGGNGMKLSTKGKELVEWMRAYEKVQDDPTTDGDITAAAGCYAGFITGVVDTAEDLNIPIVTTGEILKIVANYLNGNPQNLNVPAYKLVIKAITEEYFNRDSRKGPFGRFWDGVTNPGGLRTASTNRSGRKKRD